MMQITTAHQTPTPVEANQIADSVMQSNKPASEAVMEFLAAQIKRNEDQTKNDLSQMIAQTTGKGMNLNVMA